MRELEAILAEGGVRELILATNSTVEGEATAHFLSELAARAASARAASPTACRWAGNSNTSTAARSRMHSPAASRCSARRPSRHVEPLGRYRVRLARRCACRRELLVQAPQPPVALVAARRERPALDGRAHRAARLAHVAAVREAAARGEPLDLDEAERALIERLHRGREVAHAGGIDEGAAAGQVDTAARRWWCAGLLPRAPAHRSRYPPPGPGGAPARTCRRPTDRRALPAAAGDRAARSASTPAPLSAEQASAP